MAILAVSFIAAVSLMRVELLDVSLMRGCQSDACWLLAVSLMRVGFVSLMLCGYFSCQSDVH